MRAPPVHPLCTPTARWVGGNATETAAGRDGASRDRGRAARPVPREPPSVAPGPAEGAAARGLNPPFTLPWHSAARTDGGEMDGALDRDPLMTERRLRLSAERMLDHVRSEMVAAHQSLSAHLERISRQYAAERDERLRLGGRSDRVAAERHEAQSRADRLDRRLFHAVEAIRDGFAIWGPDGLLVQANPPFVRIFDGALLPQPGTSWAALLEAAAEEGVIDIGAASTAGWVADMVALRESEDPEPVLLQLFDGRAVRLQDRRTEDGDVVSLAVDVTAEREREAALVRARTEAEAAVRAKSRFLARMSHEFRTPMNGVIGMSDLLLEGEMDEEARACVDAIRDSGLSLLDIVNDVLDAARLEVGQLTLRPAAFDLERTLTQVVRLASAADGAAGRVTLHYPLDAPTRLVGDEARLRQIATNLVGNAVKFAAGGEVCVRVRATRRDDAVRLAIEVVDSGPGIPPERRGFVFGEFARLEGETREGAGLGLAIARDLARLMGGDLRLLDRDGGAEAGAHFELSCTLPLAADAPRPPRLPRVVRMPEGGSRLGSALGRRLRAAGVEVRRDRGDAVPPPPLLVPTDLPPDAQRALAAEAGAGRLVMLGPRAAAAPDLLARADAVLPAPCTRADLAGALFGAAPARPAAAREGGACRILAVDDVATNRLLISKMLAGSAREVVPAEDGDVAVERFAAEPFDLVLLDISMPRMDGREAARLIRALPGGAAVPIVAMTAHADAEEIADIRAAGIDEVMVKPIRKPELLRLLAAVETADGT